MNDQLENKLSMYEKVQLNVTTHAIETAGVPAIATTKTELDLVVAKILTSAGISNLDITGYTVQKQNKRNDMSSVLKKVTAGLTAYYSINNQPQEAEKWDETSSMIDGMRDNDIYTYSQRALVASVANVAALAPFGILPADNTSLTTLNADFLLLIESPKNRIGERGAELNNLERLFEQADNILINKLDPLMRIFETTNPTLYDTYKNARSIDDTGTITAPDYEGSIGANEIRKIAEIPYQSSRLFKVKNLGPATISFSLSNDPLNTEANEFVVAPGQTIQRLSSNLKVNSDFLVLKNADASLTAVYQIRIEE